METSPNLVSSSTWVTRVMDRRPGIESAPHLAAVQQDVSDVSVFMHIFLLLLFTCNTNIHGRCMHDVHVMDATVPEKLKTPSKAKTPAAMPGNPIVDDIESCLSNGRVHYKKLVHFLRSLQASLQGRGVAMYTTGVICFARSYNNACCSIQFLFHIPHIR